MGAAAAGPNRAATAVRLMRSSDAVSAQPSRRGTLGAHGANGVKDNVVESAGVSVCRERPGGKEEGMKLSARNQIPARVTAISAGEAIANVELDANGVRMVASITLEAVRQLGLTEGSSVVAVIKASDVIVAVDE